MNTNYFILYLAIFTLLLLIGIFQWGSYISYYFAISIENFSLSSSPENNYNSFNNTHSYSQTINMPLFKNTNSCDNFCGPSAKCAKTGDQCTSDNDCTDCAKSESSITADSNIVAASDAGKLSLYAPQYSSLTNGYGTDQKIIIKNYNEKPPEPNLGLNVWFSSFSEGEKLFKQRYEPPNNLDNMPNYSQYYSLTGEFNDTGPLPSNTYL
jgi:hypothetical protein